MRGGLIGAVLVLTLYGGYHFDVLGFELTSNDGASSDDAPPSVASSLTSNPPRSFFSQALPTATSTIEPTATATAEPEPELTATPEPEEQITALIVEAEGEPTATPEPEPTATPEPPTPTPEPPTPTPTATPVPSTPTPVPPTATPTVGVAMGVLVTPKSAARSAAPAATPPPSGSAIALTGTISGKVTPYSDTLKGNTLGCNGYGVYDPNDATTAAVGWALHDSVPCGTQLELCNGSTCITVVRKDTCPGCAGAHIDLSRKAFDTLCGTVNECSVTIRKK